MSPDFLSERTPNERVVSAIASRWLIAAPMRRKGFLSAITSEFLPLSLAQGIVDLAWALDLPDEKFVLLIMRLAREAHFDSIKSVVRFPKIPWPLKELR